MRLLVVVALLLGCYIIAFSAIGAFAAAPLNAIHHGSRRINNDPKRLEAFTEAVQRIKAGLQDPAVRQQITENANKKQKNIPHALMKKLQASGQLPPLDQGKAPVANPDATRSFWDICDQVFGLGYACEHHVSPTQDGFQLDVIHIPPQPTEAQDAESIRRFGAGNGYPVILQHGLIDTASAWVANYFAYQNLGTILSSAGYDVWMPNARGNHYSMANTIYSQDDAEYWERIDMDFMALYDMPANIDYVLNYTRRSTLSYVGHSQGGMMGFGAFSTWHPQLYKKVDYFFALAPACWVHHTTAIAIVLLADLDIAQWLELFGVKSFLDNSFMEWVLSQICPDIGGACALLLDFICGFSNQVNSSQMATVTRYTPGGTSVSNMLHWEQEVQTEEWATHDFGPALNQKYWNQTSKIPYTPNAMLGPKTVLFFGSDDALADPADVENLLSQVPAEIMLEKKYLQGYAHLDFTWGMNAHIDIYPTILGYLGNVTKH